MQIVVKTPSELKKLSKSRLLKINESISNRLYFLHGKPNRANYGKVIEDNEEIRILEKYRTDIQNSLESKS